MMLYKQLQEHEDKFAEYLWMSAKTFDLFFFFQISILFFHSFFFQKLEGT
jgi:hypothetical protein